MAQFLNTDQTETIAGSSDADTFLIASNSTGGGNDRFSGRAGDDEAQGGTGDDRLFGGLGRDRLFGGGGNDVFIETNDSVRTAATPTSAAQGGTRSASSGPRTAPRRTPTRSPTSRSASIPWTCAT